MRKTKKLFLLVAISLCFITVTPSFSPIVSPFTETAEAGTKIKLNKTKETLVKGQTLQLKVKGTTKKIKWYTSKKKVASVSRKGKVKAKSKGTAKITAKIGKKKYSCKITVVDKGISKRSISLYPNQTYQLKVYGTSKYVMWASNNKRVAKISSKGKITAAGVGYATITATVGSGSKNKKYSCKITVNSRLSCKKTFIRCYPGEYQTLRIYTRGMAANETLFFYNKNHHFVNITWDEKSEYNDLIFVPKKPGRADIEVHVCRDSSSDFKIYNDYIPLNIVSYPDKSGWLKASYLDNFGVDFTDFKDGTACINLIFDSLAQPLPYELDTQKDIKNSDGTYSSDDFTYKIVNGEYYFKIQSLENMFFI